MKSSIEEPALKETATAAPAVERPANALHENHPEESPRPTPTIPEPLRPGKLFAWFELQRELDVASTGAVWLAQDYGVRRHGEQVALKFLPDFIVSDKTGFEKLKSEIRRRIALRHPNILRVYNLVENKGRVAVQMEYLDGQSLSHLRLTRPNQTFEVRDLEKWVQELCEALQYAHNDVGFIDGGIVPANLIVDRAGNLKLKDFGIASCINDSMSRLMAIHDTSETLPYKSPQRAKGEEPAITDDLYSLGSIIYELLTGRPPFYAGDLGAQVCGKIPPSMTERRAELGIAGEGIPKNWEETVAACLAKDPAQRPESAFEVEKRLKNDSFPSDIPVTPTAKSVPDSIARPQSPIRTLPARKPWMVMMGVVFVLALSAIAFFLFHHLTEPKLGKRGDQESFHLTHLVPGKGPSPTSKAPPLSSGSNGNESSLSVAAPSPEPSPTPSPEMGPTLLYDLSPIPSSEVISTLSLDLSPTLFSEVNPTSSPEVTATPSPEVSPTPSPEVRSTISPQETAAPNATQSAGPSPKLLSQRDIDAIKEDVVRRINALPRVTAEGKANLIEKMHKARSMERLTVIPFDFGQTALRRGATDELVKAFDRPEMRDKVNDPTIVLVVAGYADNGGRADLNLRISQERAEHVSRILKEQARLLNAMQIIGMGGTELLDSKRPDQNRAVEVWAVLPL